MGMKIMNKLLLADGINKVKSGEYKLDNAPKKIEICGEVIIHYENKNNENIEIEVKDNNKLIIYNLYDITNDVKILINLNNNSKIIYNLLLINDGKNKVNLNLNMNGNKSEALIKVHIINKNSDSNINFICDGKIEENTIDNVLTEDLKGLIISDDSIKISPNMEVLTNEVIANHEVAIASFKSEDLFYFQSRGLNLEEAQNLLIKGFVNSILSEELRNDLKMEVRAIE